MVRDEEKYQQAIGLRKRGFTLEEIAKYCDISKSTASVWLKNKAFSAQVTKQNTKRAGQENAKRLALIAKTRTHEREKRYADAERSAKVEFNHYKDDQLFMTGLVAYLTSGDQQDDRLVRFSHKTPDLHRLFVRFCVDYLGVEKQSIHIWLQLYPDSEEEKAMRKWSKVSTLPLHQFYKCQFVNKGSQKRLHDGVGNTIIGSTYHKQKLKAWLRMAKKLW